MCGGVGDVNVLLCNWLCVQVMHVTFFIFYSPVVGKTGFLPRVLTRPDLLLYSIKFNEFFVVFIGIDRYEESTSLFCKSTIQSHVLFF